MRSFESIAKELKTSTHRVERTYFSAIRKLRKYVREHEELKDYLLYDTSNSEVDLLKILYDEYGKDKI